MKTRNHRLPSNRARPRPAVELLEERLLLSDLQGASDVTIVGPPAPVASSAAIPTIPTVVAVPPVAAPPTTAIPAPAPIPGLLDQLLAIPTNPPVVPVPPSAGAAVAAVLPTTPSAATVALPGPPNVPTGPTNHIPPSRASVPGTLPPPIAELIPLNGSPLAVVVTLSSVVPATDSAGRFASVQVDGSTLRVPQPIRLASLPFSNVAEASRASVDEGRGGLHLLTIVPSDRQAPAARDEPETIPSAASAPTSLAGRPSTPEKSSSTPIGIHQDRSSPRISPDKPERRTSPEAAEDAVVLATFTAFAWLIIRAATVAPQRSSQDSFVTEFQTTRLLDSMTGSWTPTVSVT
jgi:hypothetical protein